MRRLKLVLACAVYIVIILAWGFCLFAPFAHAQTDNTVYVKQFTGPDIGTKTTNAQNACNANTAITCIVIFDPTLSQWPVGTMPAKCSQCVWLDYRSPMNLANMTYVGNWSSLSNYALADVVLYNGVAYLNIAPVTSVTPIPTFIQANSTILTAGSSPATVAYSQNVTAGNLLVVFAGSTGNAASITVNDSLGTVYTKAISQTGNGNNIAAYYGVTPASGADSVTVSGWGTWPAVQVQEWTGITNQLAGTPTQSANGGGTASGAVSLSMTTTAPALMLWNVMSNHQSSPFSITAGGFTQTFASTHEGMWTLSQTVSTATTQSGSVNLGSYNNDAAASVMLAFQEGVNPPPVDVAHWIPLSSLAYNFSSTQPAAQANYQNAVIQTQGQQVSVEIPYASTSGFGLLECGSGVTCTNGVLSVATPSNLNSTTPAAQSGYQNATIQTSGSNVSVEIPYASASGFGLLECGSGVTCSSGVISVTAPAVATIHTAKKTSGTCTTGSSSYSSCPDVLTWSGGGFTGNPTVVQCTGIGGSDPRAYWQVTSYNATTVTFETITGGSQAVSFSEIDCEGTIAASGQ